MAIYFYKKAGTGPAVILLHGFPEHGTLWRSIEAGLAPHFTLIIPDLPGSGKTPLTQPAGIADMAAGIRQIMDKEGIDKAVLAGHSMGGYVAFAFAALFPGRLAGLSAVHSTPAADDEEKKKNRRRVIELIERGGKTPFIESMVPNLFSAYFKQLHPDAVEEQVRESLNMDEASIVNFYTAMLQREDRTGLLKGLPFPVQWVIGADDTTLPYKKILEIAHESDINVVTFYKNCGHMSMLEQPQQLMSDLKSFIQYCYSNTSRKNV